LRVELEWIWQLLAAGRSREKMVEEGKGVRKCHKYRKLS